MEENTAHVNTDVNTATSSTEQECISKNSIFDEIVKLSGLDENLVASELNEHIRSLGKRPQDLTLPELRAVISQYARKTILEAYSSD